jgi:hypothetical protein
MVMSTVIAARGSLQHEKTRPVNTAAAANATPAAPSRSVIDFPAVLCGALRKLRTQYLKPPRLSRCWVLYVVHGVNVKSLLTPRIDATGCGAMSPHRRTSNLRTPKGVIPLRFERRGAEDQPRGAPRKQGERIHAAQWGRLDPRTNL